MKSRMQSRATRRGWPHLRTRVYLILVLSFEVDLRSLSGWFDGWVWRCTRASASVGGRWDLEIAIAMISIWATIDQRLSTQLRVICWIFESRSRMLDVGFWSSENDDVSWCIPHPWWPRCLRQGGAVRPVTESVMRRGLPLRLRVETAEGWGRNPAQVSTDERVCALLLCCIWHSAAKLLDLL